MNTTLQETIGLIRATHLFARNYKEGAPPISNDRYAMTCAFMVVEDALISALRDAIEQTYPPGPECDKLIAAEIARLESEPHWRFAMQSSAPSEDAA